MSLSNEKIDILTQTKTQLVAFMDDLIASYDKESDFVVARIFLKDQVPIEDVMNYIVKHILPFRKVIKERNDTFFLQNNVLFEKINNNKINHFRKLWTDPTMDDEERNIIWKWFDTFIYLADKYERCCEQN